jgi:hypothetical protein
MNKKILLILLLSFILLSTKNIFSYQIYYYNQGYIPNILITPYLYSREFLPGQNITGYVFIQNNDPYYYPQIFLGIMLVNENLSFGTQVLYAELKMISNLLPYENYTVNFSYQIPENISSGNYELLFYLYTATKHIIGNPNNFSTPIYENIYISNPNIGNYPWIAIVRNQTELIINNNKVLNLNLSLYSLYNTNATINIKLAAWDAILYGAIYNNSFNVELKQGYNYIYDNINVSNLYPGIYYILIEVYSGKLLQDLHIIPYYVYGESLSFDGIYLNNNGTLLIILSAYPNDNKNHVLYNVGLTIYSNNQNFQNSINIGNLLYNSTKYIYIYDNVPMINGEDLCFNLTYQKEVNGLTYLSNICYTYYLTNQTKKSSSDYSTEIKVIAVLIIVAGLVTYLLIKK